MPESLIKLLDSGEAQMVGTQWDEQEAEKPAYIRRMYLQSLYRFFRLFPNRADFRNPFNATDDYLFFARPTMAVVSHMPQEAAPAIARQYTQVASFLYKRKRHADVLQLIEAYNGPMTPMLHLLYGNVLLTQQPDQGQEAANAFRQALLTDDATNREQALSGLARAEFREGHYLEALSCYSQLLDLRPEKKSYLLNQSVCLMQLTHYEEALKVLYKLNYEHPDDDNVSRVLAWALVGDGKCEQAAKIYQRLLADEATSVDDDLLNYGYCLWTAGDTAGAATMLRQYAALMDERSASPQADRSGSPQGNKKADMHHEFFVTEYPLLTRAGITDEEIRLMLDQLHTLSSTSY
jgi:tetratricopeptide (TPR) repeat protein